MHLTRKTIMGLLVSIVLFAAAVWFLVHNVREYNFAEIMQHVRSLPNHRIILACVFMILSYLSLTLYDLLALRHMRHPIDWKPIVFISFIAHAISNSVGFAFVSANSVRLRLYAAFGVNTFDVLRIVAFTNLTFMIGISTIGGLLLVFLPPELPAGSTLTDPMLRWIGGGMLTFACGYLLFSLSAYKTLRLWQWEFPLPSFHAAIGQILVTMFDWVLTALSLYVLLPEGTLPFLPFLSIFVATHIAGAASNIPGGLGVFEVTSLVLLSPFLETSAILGTIVLYRIVYYVLPLTMGILLFCAYEIHSKRQHWVTLLRWVGGSRQ